MADIRRDSETQDHNTGESADHEQVRAAAKAGYQGDDKVVQLSEAVKQREHRRAEREREAYKIHYLGTPPKPR